jgi:hypothetical protein
MRKNKKNKTVTILCHFEIPNNLYTKDETFDCIITKTCENTIYISYMFDVENSFDYELEEQDPFYIHECDNDLFDSYDVISYNTPDDELKLNIFKTFIPNKYITYISSYTMINNISKKKTKSLDDIIEIYGGGIIGEDESFYDMYKQAEYDIRKYKIHKLIL